MANTFKFGNGEWAVGKETALAYNDENNNFKPLPFSFDRASSATVVNKNGLIETVGVDEPRIDFLNNTKGHLLLEPSRRNEVTYSEDLSEWTTTDLSITSNSLVSPDGTQNADKVTATANFARIQYTYTLSASTTYTISFYVKNISAVNPRVQVYDNTNATNLLNTYYGSELTGEWKKLTYSFTTTTGTSILVRPVRDLNNAEEMYIWGIQLEAGSYATSYIPTSGSAVTRSAETANGAGNSNVFNDSEGVLYAEIAPLANDGTNRHIGISDNTNTNRLQIFFNTHTTTQIRTLNLVSNVKYFDMTSDVTLVNGYGKVAIKYKENDFALWVNGVEVATDNSGLVWGNGVLDTLKFADGNDASPFYGKVKDLKVYNTALSDSELQALTTI